MLLAPPPRDINKKNAVSCTTHNSEAHAHTGAHACTWPSHCCPRGTRVSLGSRAGVQTSPAGRCCSWQSRVAEGCWGGRWGPSPWSSLPLSWNNARSTRGSVYRERRGLGFRKPGSDQRGIGEGAFFYSQPPSRVPRSSHQFPAKTAAS